jgi:hypothetical protein
MIRYPVAFQSLEFHDLPIYFYLKHPPRKKTKYLDKLISNMKNNNKYAKKKVFQVRET